MIKDVPLTQEFLDALDPVWPDARGYPSSALGQRERGVNSYMYAYADEDGPLWAWGLYPYWAGVGEIWMIFDKRAGSFVRDIVREAQMLLVVFEKEMGFRRMQGIIDCRVTSSARLALLLGFEQEGILRNYGVGGEQDFVLYARTS